MLLEDEHGTINLIISPPVHDRFRLAVRSEPLVLASGRLECREGTANVIVDRIERLDRPDLPNAQVKHIEPRRVWSSDAGELSAVAAEGAQLRQARLGNIQGMAGRIRVGTSSWADPGFVKEWYPPKMPAKERLPWYAQRFEHGRAELELLRDPRPQHRPRLGGDHAAGLHLRREGPSRAVAPRRACRVPAARPARAARHARTWSARSPSGSWRRRRRSAMPGRFGAYLLQLTPAFSPRKHRLEELDGLVEILGPHGLAVELRNRNWVEDDRREPTLDWFADRGVAFVGVDAPPGDNFQIMPPIDAVTNPSIAYLRAHGRNTQGYLTGKLRGRALRVAVHGRGAGGDRASAPGESPSTPGRCTWRSTTTAATTHPRRLSAFARYSARRRRSRRASSSASRAAAASRRGAARTRRAWRARRA